jgi:predicted RNA binding protein YcfA (HicA-like mRNA interferase family)
MKVRDLVKRIKKLGGAQARRGSSGHAVFVCSCGKHKTSIQVQRMDLQLPLGTLRHIQKDLAGCWGSDWMK